MERVGLGVLAAACGLLQLGCENEKVKACHAEMAVSQQALLDMDKNEIDSVEAALGLIDKTLAACREAQRSEEVGNVESAKRQVAAHLAALEERASRPERKELSPEELESLIKNGDPDCPKGQGYEHPKAKEVIKCTGKQIVEMSQKLARAHFERRGYKITEGKTEAGGARVKAEFGARAYEFIYEGHGAGAAPSCVLVTGKPGVPWQELVARTAGVHPDRVERGQPVTVSGKSLQVQVAGDVGQWTVSLGSCPARP